MLFVPCLLQEGRLWSHFCVALWLLGFCHFCGDLSYLPNIQPHPPNQPSSYAVSLQVLDSQKLLFSGKGAKLDL